MSRVKNWKVASLVLVSKEKSLKLSKRWLYVAEGPCGITYLLENNASQRMTHEYYWSLRLLHNGEDQ